MITFILSDYLHSLLELILATLYVPKGAYMHLKIATVSLGDILVFRLFYEYLWAHGQYTYSWE